MYCLQKIQNTAARFLARLPRFSHISATLFDLHWLPIRYRITFKICILTYQAYHRIASSLDFKSTLLLLLCSRHHNVTDDLIVDVKREKKFF